MRRLSTRAALFGLLPVAAVAAAVAVLPTAYAEDTDGPTVTNPLSRRLPHGVRATGPRTPAASAATATSSVPAAGSPATTAAAKPWDLNGDGYADLVVGVPEENLGDDVNAGGFHVMYSGASGVTASGSKFIHQDTAGVPGSPEDHDYMGEVSASGDFNADGYADAAISVVGENGNGRVYVFYGAASGLSTSTVTVLSNITTGEAAFGYHMAAGDLNGDGYADLVASDPSNIDALVFTGASDGLSQTRKGSLAVGGAIEDGFGMTVAVGDIDGDGIDDVAVAEPFADAGGRAYPTGQVWVFRSTGGTQVFSKDTEGIKGAGASPGTDAAPDLFGFSLAIGDYDGDGYADLAAGAPGSPVTYTSSGSTVKKQDAGTINVIYGGSTGLTTADEYLHQAISGVPGTPGVSDYFGWMLAAGKTNNDSTSELAAFSVRENMVVAFKGVTGTGLEPVSAKVWTQNTSGVPGGTESEDAWGNSLRFADYKGTGYAGLTVGAPGENSNAGAVTLLYSTSSGLTASGSKMFTQNTTGVPGTSEKNDFFGTFY